MEDLNPVFVFNVALATATTLAALQEIREGRWRGLPVGTRLTRGGVITVESYKPIQFATRLALVIRIAAPALFSIGLISRVAAIFTFAALTFAILLRFKHNTLFMTTGFGITLCASTIPTFDSPESDAWTLCSISVLLAGLYVGGAASKFRSRQFRSGEALYLIITARIPATFDVQHIPRTVWRTLSLSVILLEVSLIVFLAIPATLSIALIAGLIMHLTFVAIQPSRLIPFQIATLGSYPAAIAGMAVLRQWI